MKRMLSAALILACTALTVLDECRTEDCQRFQARLATTSGIEGFRKAAAEIREWPDEQSRLSLTIQLDLALTNWLLVDAGRTVALIETHDELLNRSAIHQIRAEEGLAPAVKQALMVLVADRKADGSIRYAAAETLLGFPDPQVRNLVAQVSSDSTDTAATSLAWLLVGHLRPDELREVAFQGHPPLRDSALIQLAREEPYGVSAQVCAIAQNAKLPPDMRWTALHVATVDCLATMADEEQWFIHEGNSLCDPRMHSLELISQRLSGMRTGRAFALLESLEASLPGLDDEARQNAAGWIDRTRTMRRQFPLMFR